MSIGNVFKRIGRVVKDAVQAAYRFVVSDEALEKAEAAARMVVEVSEKVLPIVRTVAALTPNKADDMIVALVERLQVKVNAHLEMSDEEKSAALKACAVKLARKTYPALEAIDDATLYAAIDLAYKLFRDMKLPEVVDVSTEQ
jgi:hypothetical protein